MFFIKYNQYINIIKYVLLFYNYTLWGKYINNFIIILIYYVKSIIFIFLFFFYIFQNSLLWRNRGKKKDFLCFFTLKYLILN